VEEHPAPDSLVKCSANQTVACGWRLRVNFWAGEMPSILWVCY
jgi:hypothetical protein